MKIKTLIYLLCGLSISAHAADLKLSLAIRNAQVNTIEPTVGPNPILRLCGGAIPSSAVAADGGRSHVRIVLPTDWMTTATNGILSKLGQWQSVVKFSGQPTHFRIYDADETTSHIQGSISISGGSGVLTIPSLSLVAGQVVRVNTFTITDANEFGTVPPSANRLQYSIAIQNAKMNTFESVIGPSAIFKIITGAMPATVAASDPGSVLITMNLPVDWISDASGGVISKLGTWSGIAGLTGVATHGSFFESNGTTRHAQVDVTGTAGTGLAKISNTSVANGDTVTVSSFSLGSGNTSMSSFPVTQWAEWGPSWGRAGLDIPRYNEPGMMSPQPGDIDNNVSENGRGMIEWRSLAAPADGMINFLSSSLFPRVSQSRPLSSYEYGGMVEQLHTYVTSNSSIPTTVTLQVTSDPFPADIWLNGASVSAGNNITLQPGWNRLMVKSRSPHGATGQVWTSTPWDLKVTLANSPSVLQFRTTDPSRIVKVTDTGKAFRYLSKILRTDGDMPVITSGSSVSATYTIQAGIGNDAAYQDQATRATNRFLGAPASYSVDPSLIPAGNPSWQVVPEATWPASLPTKASVKVLDDKGQNILQQQFPLSFGSIIGGLVTATIPLSFGTLGVGNYVIKSDLVDASNNVLVHDNDHSFSVVAPVANRAEDQKPRILGVTGHFVAGHDYGKAFRWMSRVGFTRHHKLWQGWDQWMGTDTAFDSSGNITIAATTSIQPVLSLASSLGIDVIGDALEGYYEAIPNNLNIPGNNQSPFPAYNSTAWNNLYFNYGFKLAQKYPTITNWGGMNELEGSGPTTSAAATQYVAAAQKIKAGILSFSASDKYTSSSTYTDFTNLWAAGFLNVPNFVDVHAHPFRAPEPGESSITPYTVQGRQLLINLGYTGPVNYGEMSSPRAHNARGARGQAEDMVKQLAWGINYREAGSAPVSGLDYLVAYESPDYDGNFLGFDNPYGDPLPVVNAANTSSILLDGRNKLTALTGLPSGVANLRVTNSDSSFPETIVIWKTDSTASVTIPVVSSQVKLVDLMGRETTQSVSGGQIVLSVTTTPQYVRGDF